jgi:trimethylamine--corrinoid protein Co-methyltransferase
MSPEALLIYNQISGYKLRSQRGFEVSPETLATELIKKVGLSGDFISTDHTREHFRHELSRGDLVVRTRRAEWETIGRPKRLDVRRLIDQPAKG